MEIQTPNAKSEAPSVSAAGQVGEAASEPGAAEQVNWLKVIGLVLLHDAALLLGAGFVLFLSIEILATAYESAPVTALIEEVHAWMAYLDWSPKE